MRYSGLRSRGRSIIATLASSTMLAAVLIGVGQSPAAAVTPPLAVDDAYTISTSTAIIEGAPGVLANDTDDVGPLTASGASDPPHGSVNLNTNGSFTYNADANFVGTDSFTYTVSDGVDGSDTGLVTITVNRDPVVLFKDIVPGANGSGPKAVTDLGNGTAVFIAFATLDPTYKGLYKTDGTAAGTALIANIDIGPNSELPSPMGPVSIGGGKAVFFASDGINGREPWVTDGTVAGTQMIADINPGAAASNPNHFTAVGGTAYFMATDPVNGNELWKTDGTGAGTVLVKDINPGTLSGNPNCGTITFTGFFVFGSKVVFCATNGVNGNEPWISDGTTAGTFMLKDINATGGSSPGSFSVFNGALYFTAGFSSSTGSELWTSDGTTAGTALVKDISPGSGSSSPGPLAPIGGIAVFAATTAANGAELWKTDGTAAGTVLLADLNPGTGNSLNSGGQFAPLGGVQLFRAGGAGLGLELWKTDGTAAGTGLVKDIRPGSATANISIHGTFGSHVYLSALTDAYSTELWRSDGTTSGTVITRDINPGAASSNPGNLVSALGTMFFSASNPTYGSELWRLAPPNTPPVAVDDGYSTNEDTALVVNAPGVVGNDTDADSNVLHDAVKMSDPLHGSVTFGGDGSFTYTPAANYNGPDSFTYQSYDGMDYSNVATVNLTVNAVVDIPVANNDSYSTNQNTSLAVSAPGVLGNDTDGDGPLTAVSLSLPANGAVAFNANGSFTYTPNGNYVGPDSFTYKANDGINDSNVATVNISVTSPAVLATPPTVAAGSPVTATWSGVSNPSATDWVGLYDTSATPDPGVLAWAYTGGASAGNLNLTVPAGATPGAGYELRLFANNTYTRLATSGTFTVTASATTIAASPGSVPAGGPVTATWAAIASPTAVDWVGLYDSAATPDAGLLAWAYTGGAAGGNLNLTVPLSAPTGATYELRLFTNNTYTRLATSAPFTVTASAATVSATPASVNAGGPVTATWSGIASPTATDWVGLYVTGADPDPSTLAWAYTDGNGAGSVNLTVPVGAPAGATYELRLFSNNTYTRLATSAPFSVVASAATVTASPASVVAGNDVTATWSGIGSPNATDWIGIYASASDPDTAIVGELVGCCVVNSWAYTAGAAAGSFTLHVPAGATPGATYELRLFSNNSYTRLATSAPFSVT